MIKVTEKYFIEVEDRQYIVCQKTIIQNGKNAGMENYINHTYHSTMVESLNNIIKRIQKDKLITDNVIELKEAIKVLVDTQKEFTDIVKGLENYE